MINNEKIILVNNKRSSVKFKKIKIANTIKLFYLKIYKIKYIIYFFISYFFFFLSLEKCFEGEDMCCVKLNWMIIKIIELIISCLILSILLYFILTKKIKKFHLVHIIIVFLMFYKYSNGYSFDNHGFFNFVAYFVLLIILLIISFLLRCLIFCFKKYFYSFIIIITSILIVVIYFSFFNLINCDDWARGLNNTSIENDNYKYGCQIKIPKNCPYKILKYIQDFTKIKGVKCSAQKKDAKKLLLKLSKSVNIQEKTNRIAFPLTNKDPSCFLDDTDDIIILDYFLKNLIDIDNNTQTNKISSEIFIDFSKNPYGEMNINVNYNETLSKNRKILEKNSTPYSNNIMIIYLDSVSRANSMRQLKKTVGFIEKYISYKGGYNRKFPESNFHSFQFFKYHSFQEHTRGNYPRLIYGSERTNKKIVRITKYLKENGFITSYAGDTCMRDNTRTLHNLTINEVDDHQMLLCDPNKDNFNQNTIKCLYGKIHTEHLLEYTNQFWRKYRFNRKFSFIILFLIAKQ